MTDFEIRQFRDHIVNALNAVDLPLEVKRLILKEIYEEVDKQTNAIIVSQMEKANVNENGKEQEENGD